MQVRSGSGAHLIDADTGWSSLENRPCCQRLRIEACANMVIYVGGGAKRLLLHGKSTDWGRPMKIRTRMGVGAGIAALLALTGATAAFGADSGWRSNTASYLLTVDGCPVIQSGASTYVSGIENPSCSGSIGVQAKYKLYAGSLTYTSSIDWDSQWARVDAPIVTHGKVYH